MSDVLTYCPECLKSYGTRCEDCEVAGCACPPSLPERTYRRHMVSVHAGNGVGYFLACTCQWRLRLTATNDAEAAQVAYDHVASPVTL
jgi:hypothetical protein